MPSRIFLPFYPERILWTGAAILGVSLAVSVAFLIFLFESSAISICPTNERPKSLGNKDKSLSFSFNLKEVPIAFTLPRVEPEMTFSFDPPRPDRSNRSGNLFVRFKQSAQSKRVTLPCRIDLQFNGSLLAFFTPDPSKFQTLDQVQGNQESLFWLELTSVPEEKIEGVVWLEAASGEKIKAETFIISPQASPFQGASEFAEESPFRILGEARWMGHDVFAEKYGGKQTLRIAMGGQENPQILDLREKEWIIWHDGSWLKGTLDEKPEAVARVESVDSKALIFEGWNGETHVRLSLPFSNPSPFKTSVKEVFNSIRVRSEKQISCMMEKQCLILRVGDWVMKNNGRWKVLRKKEEKDAYQSGKIGGELFVFEKIELKQGQKLISGFLFNAEKTQLVPIDLPAKNLSRKEVKEK
jgi:hypothetical protein